MIEGVDIKVEWEELIDSFSEDASTLQILSACINKFGDGGCGLSFSDWGAIVRNHLEEKELQSESFWEKFEYADSSDDYYSEKEYTDEELLPIDVSLPLNIEENLFIDDESNNVLRIYITEALKYRQLTNEESLKLLKRYKNGDSKAYDILVKSNIRFAIYVVQWYKGKGIAYEDLIQESVLGILRAIQHADSSCRNFTDYIKTYVFQSVLTAGIILPYLIKIPANQVRTHKKVRDFIEKYELQYGHEPSLMEIEDYFYDDNIDVSTVHKLPSELTDFTYSFDDWEIVEDNLLHIDDSLEQEHNKTYVKRLLNSLTYKESLILRKYYGIDEPMELSLEDIGEKLFLTRERVRQIHAKAISKLREQLDSKGTIEVPVDEQVKEHTIKKKKSTVANPLPVKSRVISIVDTPIKEKAIRVISSINRGNVKEHPKVVELDKPKSLNRHRITILKITYPNGILEESDDYLTTYLNFIKYVGPERVRKLFIRSYGVNLVVRKEEIPLKYEKCFKDVGNGYFFNSFSSTQRKYDVMNFISEKLNLGIKIELIEREFSTNLNAKEVGSRIINKDVESTQGPLTEPQGKNEPKNSIIEYQEKCLNSNSSIEESVEEVITTPIDESVAETTSIVNDAHVEEEVIRVISTIENRKESNVPIDIESQISQINSITINGEHKSPHMAIYLLTLIECIHKGFMNPNKIYLNDRLIITFNLLWNKYVPPQTPFGYGIANPFVLLSKVSFYQLNLLKPIDIKSTNWTIDMVRKVCKFAYVSKEFCYYISSEENRKRVLDILTNNLLLDSSSKSEENTQEIPIIEEAKVEEEGAIVIAEVPSLPKSDFLKKRGAVLLKVTYPNGYIEESDRYIDIFTEFVKYAGPKRVRELNIYSLGVNLVVPKEEILTKYESGFKDVGNGYFLNTVSATHRKYEIMNFISEKLNLGIKIELVASEDSIKDKVKKPTQHIAHKDVKPIYSPQQKLHDDTDLQNSIIDYITRFPNSKASNIADYLGVPRKEINSILYRLQKEERCEINAWFQWRIAEVSSPISVVKEPTQVYLRKNSVSKNIETSAYGRIFSMRCSNRDGYKAPHKAIYLLSVIDCVELGEIKSRRFDITSLLLQRFEENWEKYVHLECFSPTIWNPIFYMEDDIIHKEWNPVFAGTKPNSLAHCELIFDYLEIASDLWDALTDKKTSKNIKSKLIAKYIQNAEISLSSVVSENISESVNYWVFPGKANIFRIVDYFNGHDVIDWKQSNYKFKVGDIVFIYVSSPISSIRYMLEVIKCDVPYEESINDEEYWEGKHENYENVKHYKYVRLKLLKSSTNEGLHLNYLAKYGMSAPQGATKKMSKELLDYILSRF